MFWVVVRWWGEVSRSNRVERVLGFLLALVSSQQPDLGHTSGVWRCVARVDAAASDGDGDGRANQHRPTIENTILIANRRVSLSLDQRQPVLRKNK